ncbi:hypothetical protein [Clostridium botulinum]|uniref:hypothetical protein n=1 Tax=Clostridium botulinum TaxID=1491 RepID=UPI00248F7582|nr:hypothetical protein [Clostridium botulinum]BDB01250.1 hypothetical protein CBOS2020_13240 [Clostridium botulinum]
MYSMPPMMCCSFYGMDFTKYDFNKALELVKDAVQGERDDERKHRKMFKFVYKFYTGKDIEASDGAGDFEKPRSYIDGIKKLCSVS